MGKRQSNKRIFIIVGMVSLLLGAIMLSSPFVEEWETTQVDGDDTYTMSVQFLRDGIVVTSGAIANEVGELITQVQVTISWTVTGEFIDWTTFTVVGSVSVLQWSMDEGVNEVDRLMGTESISSTERSADGSGSQTVVVSLNYVDEREYWDEVAGTYKIEVKCNVAFDVRDDSYHVMPTYNLNTKIDFFVYNLSGTWNVDSDLGFTTASMFGTPTQASTMGVVFIIAGMVLLVVGLRQKRR